MPKFIRTLHEDVISKLEAEPLYTAPGMLRSDIREGQVFPAIRNNRIDFYHKGGRLFTFGTGGFKTHVKYASVLLGTDEDITEDDLKEARVRLLRSFSEAYKRIKENCSMFADEEREGVSRLYGTSSYARDDADKQEVVVLDVEIGLSGDDSSAKVDIVDVLLYHKKQKCLRFYEVKRFDNKELWSSKGKPRVVAQLERYNEKIGHRRQQILDAYTENIKCLESLFGKKLDAPESIDQEGVVLLVFGFDFLQRSKLQDDLKHLLEKYKCRWRFVGDLSRTTADKIWKKV